MESCRAVTTWSLKEGPVWCSGVSVVVRAGRSGCHSREDHGKQLDKILLELQDENPTATAWDVRTGAGRGVPQYWGWLLGDSVLAFLCCCVLPWVFFFF